MSSRQQFTALQLKEISLINSSMKREIAVNKAYKEILKAASEGHTNVKVKFEGQYGYEFSDIDLEAIEEVKKCFPGIESELEKFGGLLFCIFSWD